MKVDLVIKKGSKTIAGEPCDEEAIRSKLEAVIEEAKRLKCEGIAFTVLLWGRERETAA